MFVPGASTGAVPRLPQYPPPGADRADWQLLNTGGVNLVRRKEFLEGRLRALEGLGYAIHRLRFTSVDAFVRELSSALRWEEQFGYGSWGGNLDALNDGFPGDLFDASDLNAFCIEDFHLFVAADRHMAEGVLDIVAREARGQFLLGKRLVLLIQTDDATYQTPPLASVHGQWSREEWSTASRGLQARRAPTPTTLK